MSAEDELRVFPMENGEFWIADCSCGDTEMDLQGKVHTIVAKAKTYEECVAIFQKLSDEKSDTFYNTEHGGVMPSEDALAKEPARLLVSNVVVKFGGRACHCVDLRDTVLPQWEVHEGIRLFKPGRRLAEGLTYAEAIHVAHRHRMVQPGESTVFFPTFFRTFESYENDGHDCEKDHWSEIEVATSHLKAFW